MTSPPTNELYESLTGMERARLGFVEEVRRAWARQVYPALRREFSATAPAPAAGSVAGALAHMRTLATYPWFAWLEREMQKMKWRQLLEMAQQHPDAVAAIGDPPGQEEPDPAPGHPGDLPGWYTGIDIHCQPGGLWWGDQAAVVYELGARILHLGANSSHELHRLFTAQCFTDLPDGARVVDLGCGFGKSTVPFAQRYPTAEVIGIDLSRPVLRLARHRARQQGLRIAYLPGDASDLALPSHSCDVVTATMLLHELPAQVLEQTLHEAARLLKPGGRVAFLEFARTGDVFRDAVVMDHAIRNNEPFLPQLLELDVVGMLERAGLTGARWTPFDERGGGPLPGGFPHRDEWHFPWAVLAAERAAGPDRHHEEAP